MRNSVIAGVALVLAALAAVFFWNSQSPPAVPAEGTPIAAAPPVDSNAGVIDRQTPEDASIEATDANAGEAAPSLFAPLPGSAQEMDAYLKSQLEGPLASPALAERLVQPSLLERVVVIVKNIAQGDLARRHWPLAGPAETFAVLEVGENSWRVADNNSARYQPYVEILEQLDGERLAQFYRLLSPQLEQAYSKLGEPGSFHQRLLAAIDLALATPAVDDAQLMLIQHKVLYQYADEALEALPDVQKLLLRIGADNRQRVLAVLTSWRPLLAEPH